MRGSYYGYCQIYRFQRPIRRREEGADGIAAKAEEGAAGRLARRQQGPGCVEEEAKESQEEQEEVSCCDAKRGDVGGPLERAGRHCLSSRAGRHLRVHRGGPIAAGRQCLSARPWTRAAWLARASSSMLACSRPSTRTRPSKPAGRRSQRKNAIAPAVLSRSATGAFTFLRTGCCALRCRIG